MQDLGRVPGPYIAAALLPALVIALLFFFDHSVSAQMAQQPEFRLEKPSAYHYDFFLLGIMTLACGLIGVPPVNGVLPQVTDDAPHRLGGLSIIPGSVHDCQAHCYHWPDCSRACDFGLLPVQAPMHTKSLASLRMGLVRKHLGKAHKQETARQGEGAATPAGASAVISAMQEKSHAIGSGAAELLEKEAESKRTNGV